MTFSISHGYLDCRQLFKYPWKTSNIFFPRDLSSPFNFTSEMPAMVPKKIITLVPFRHKAYDVTGGGLKTERAV